MDQSAHDPRRPAHRPNEPVLIPATITGSQHDAGLYRVHIDDGRGGTTLDLPATLLRRPRPGPAADIDPDELLIISTQIEQFANGLDHADVLREAMARSARAEAARIRRLAEGLLRHAA